MLRTIVRSACRNSALTYNRTAPAFLSQRANFSILNSTTNSTSLLPQTTLKCLTPAPITNLLQIAPSAASQQSSARTVTKFSLNKGKRKSVKAVVKRFKRLDWGMWIRTYCGRHKKLWKKSMARRRRLRQHVFTNSTQSWLLDKMVTSFWRRPKYYVNDPYEPYHRRDEFFATKSKTFKV